MGFKVGKQGCKHQRQKKEEAGIPKPSLFTSTLNSRTCPMYINEHSLTCKMHAAAGGFFFYYCISDPPKMCNWVV